MPLKPKEHLVLSAIYQLRCLTYDQIYNYVFQCDTLSQGYCANVLSKLAINNYIEKTGYFNKDSYYTLSAKGIAILRKNGVIPLGKNQGKPEFQNILPAHLIKMNNAKVPHQLALNQFILDFIKYYPSYEFDYYDEKYASRIITNIMPDGIIKINNTLFFLEMDMGTERKSRLLKKWEYYRNFLHSESYYKTPYNIKVLFILGNISKNSSRKYALKKYIDSNLRPDICTKFNVYINYPENLYPLFDLSKGNVSELPKSFYNHGFSVSKGLFSESSLQHIVFDYYIYKTDSDGGLLSEHGLSMDFLVDDYTDENMYVYKKIKTFPKISSLYQKEKSRNIKYLVVVNSIDEAYFLLEQTDSYYDNLYFTTKKRLTEYTLYSAIFTIGRNGIVYHFSDGNFKIKIEEKYINSSFQ